MNQALTIKNLFTGYGSNTILRNISFTLGKAEVLAVIGQNGSGKSTLLKTIARIIADNEGEIYFGDNNLKTVRTSDLKKYGISWFVQGGMVFPTMKVKEHFEVALKNEHKDERKRIVDECYTYFPALKNVLETRGGNLSGGQVQMLSYAMLLAQKTNCWLLDEPTAGLSPVAVNDSFRFLEKIKATGKVSMLLIEHNFSFSFRLADRVGIIKNGNWVDGFGRDQFEKNDFLDLNLYN